MFGISRCVDYPSLPKIHLFRSSRRNTFLFYFLYINWLFRLLMPVNRYSFTYLELISAWLWVELCIAIHQSIIPSRVLTTRQICSRWWELFSFGCSGQASILQASKARRGNVRSSTLTCPWPPARLSPSPSRDSSLQKENSIW